MQNGNLDVELTMNKVGENMASFDIKELTDFENELLDLAKDLDNGKHAKRFLRSAGSKLRRRTVNVARARTNKRTGNLLKGIKRGKPYKYYLDGSMAVRVYGSSPHTHLLNNGHRIVAPYTGEEKGFAKGHYFFEGGLKQYEDQYYKDIQSFIDDMIDNHLL